MVYKPGVYTFPTGALIPKDLRKAYPLSDREVNNRALAFRTARPPNSRRTLFALSFGVNGLTRLAIWSPLVDCLRKTHLPSPRRAAERRVAA